MTAEVFGEALDRFLQLDVIGVVLAAAAYGLFVGAIPGLTATMAVALIVPLTFFLDAIPALAAIVTLEACAIFAGDIPTTLLRIPGTPASAAYVDDAYALTQKRRHLRSLGTSLVFSVCGGLLGAVVLILAAPAVSSVAQEFSSVENFWLTLLGLSCAVVVSRGSMLKGGVALLLGLLLSTIGLSAVHSEPRFTFSRDELIGGVNFIPAMIGLFGVSEILRHVIKPHEHLNLGVSEDGSTRSSESAVSPLREILIEPSVHLLKRGWQLIRSSAIGSFIGMLPGAGADIAAWISYAISKRFSKNKELYGKGSLDGVADATGANNAALAGAWMPSLILGIPGDSVTAIVLGVLMMKNVTPGPDILETQGTLVAGIYLTFILANLALIPLGFLAIRLASHVVRVPRRVLLPAILVFSIVGAFSISGSYFDVVLMLALGVLGFGLEKLSVPLGPVVLGIILGGKVEETFIQTWTKYGSVGGFFDPERAWALRLGILTILIWLAPLVVAVLRRSRGNVGKP